MKNHNQIRSMGSKNNNLQKQIESLTKKNKILKESNRNMQSYDVMKFEEKYQEGFAEGISKGQKEIIEIIDNCHKHWHEIDKRGAYNDEKCSEDNCSFTHIKSQIQSPLSEQQQKKSELRPESMKNISLGEGGGAIPSGDNNSDRDKLIEQFREIINYHESFFQDEYLLYGEKQILTDIVLGRFTRMKEELDKLKSGDSNG